MTDLDRLMAIKFKVKECYELASNMKEDGDEITARFIAINTLINFYIGERYKEQISTLDILFKQLKESAKIDK